MLCGLSVATPAFADHVAAISGVFCDTRQQIERFLDLWNGINDAEAKRIINKEAGKEGACVTDAALVFKGQFYEPKASQTGIWKPTQVFVVGLITEEGITAVLVPLEQFVALPAENGKPKQSKCTGDDCA
jgi:hypothetical protein